MKSLKEFSLNISEQEYHDLPVWSYSMIAKYAKNGFSAIATLHDKTNPTPEMEFGSLFDSILTKGKQTLDEYIIDDTGVSCPPAEKEVFDKLIEFGLDNMSFDEICSKRPDLLSDIMNHCESFCGKYKKEETKIANLVKNSAYYDLHRTGKKVISKKDWDDAVAMARVFRQDPFLANLFGTKSNDKVEYLYQLQFVTDYTLADGREVKVKIMPDLLKVNHEEKTIRPVDLKTSSVPGFSFPEQFVRMRYDIQGAEYTDVLEKVIRSIPEYEDYTILPYYFTDISRSDMTPVTWEWNPRDDSQVYGFTFGTEEKSYTYKTWQELLSEIITYEETNATVPMGVTREGPNDLVKYLSKR